MTSHSVDDPPAIGGFTASERGWLFAGALSLDDAADVLAAANAMPLPANGVIDMRGLMQADSSALAVIIALRRRAAGEGRKLSVVGLPPSLRSLAVVFGVEDLVE